MRTTNPPTKATQWVSRLLRDKVLRPRIDRWLASVGPGLEIRYEAGDPECYGSGHYGSAFALQDKGTYDSQWVLKVTRDPTEGPMCDWLRKQQEGGDGVLLGGFARMLAVAKLPDTFSLRGKLWPVYLIVREEVEPNSWDRRSDDAYEERNRRAGTTALNTIQSAARELAKPRKRGVATVRVWDGSSGGTYRRIDAARAMQDQIDVLESTPGFSQIGSAIRELRDEHKILLLDAHANNVGKRLYEQDVGDGNTDGTNVGDYVIFDPGHTPTPNQTQVLRVLDNPRRR